MYSPLLVCINVCIFSCLQCICICIVSVLSLCRNLHIYYMCSIVLFVYRSICMSNVVKCAGTACIMFIMAGMCSCTELFVCRNVYALYCSCSNVRLSSVIPMQILLMVIYVTMRCGSLHVIVRAVYGQFCS